MLDHDPSEYGQTISPDELVTALVAIHPELGQAARIVRGSMSAGVRKKRGKPKQNRGFHVYIPVVDARGIPSYGEILVDRLWLKGYGFIALAANGKMLERTLIDGAVFSPERLDFVGAPIIKDPGLVYTAPEPVYVEGNLLPTITLPNLTAAELATIAKLKADAKEGMKSAAEAKQKQWAEDRVAAMVASGTPLDQAQDTIDRMLSHECQELYGEFLLEFAGGLGTVTVADILNDPKKYDRKALADPIEGKNYGATTAKFYWNGGRPTINSQAHGGCKYSLSLEPPQQQSGQVVSFTVPQLAVTDVRDGTYQTRALTELGNALRLLDAHGDNIRYVADAKAWLHWRGGAWHWDVDGALARGLAAELPRQIYNEGIGQSLSDAEFFAKWARTSQKERTIESAVSLLEDFEQIRLPLSLVDADLFLVGIDNARQVIDLKTGTVRPAAQSDLITKSLNLEYMGDAAKAERWLEFLGQIFGDDPELIDWLQRWCGYLLTGSTIEQIFLFLFGLGSNGKGVFSDTIHFILGDYSRTISSETLTDNKRQAGAASPDLAQLIGARLAMSSETEDGVALSESLVKKITGCEAISVRKLYTAPVQFVPQFKLMMIGNHKPVIRGTDHGIWRRVRLVRFNRTFKPDERDYNLSAKLKTEAPHILAWMVEGCLAWQERGLRGIPQTILHATAEYQDEQDLIGNWLTECCTTSPKAETKSTALYSSYSTWCLENGHRSSSSATLTRRLSERGFSSRRSNGVRMWTGISLTKPTKEPRY
jgi:P4 family phage/plasmid primase-like protien